MALIARTKIIHGRADEEDLVFEPGEPVTGLPDDALEELQANGAVGEEIHETDYTEQIQELESEIDYLRGQLAARDAANATDGTTGVSEGMLRAHPDYDPEKASGEVVEDPDEEPAPEPEAPVEETTPAPPTPEDPSLSSGT